MQGRNDNKPTGYCFACGRVTVRCKDCGRCMEHDAEPECVPEQVHTTGLLLLFAAVTGATGIEDIMDGLVGDDSKTVQNEGLGQYRHHSPESRLARSQSTSDRAKTSPITAPAGVVGPTAARYATEPAPAGATVVVGDTAIKADNHGANARQVGGDHYKKQKIEHWDYIVANHIPYLEAQVIKYASRWRNKNGIQDLEKAKHFLEKAIEVGRDETAGSPVERSGISVNDYLLHLAQCLSNLVTVNRDKTPAELDYVFKRFLEKELFL